jgi:hypothetical protein
LDKKNGYDPKNTSNKVKMNRGNIVHSKGNNPKKEEPTYRIGEIITNYT